MRQRLPNCLGESESAPGCLDLRSTKIRSQRAPVQLCCSSQRLFQNSLEENERSQDFRGRLGVSYLNRSLLQAGVPDSRVRNPPLYLIRDRNGDQNILSTSLKPIIRFPCLADDLKQHVWLRFGAVRAWSPSQQRKYGAQRQHVDHQAFASYV